VESVEGNGEVSGRDIRIVHLPGHSPDSLAVQIGEEALLVGDILLPDITPHPSQEKFYLQTQQILSPRYAEAREIYGLGAYLGSLKKLQAIAGRFPGLMVLPGHRLFYNGCWNEMDLGKRIEEILEHHVQRCAALVEVLKRGPRSPEEVAGQIFEPRLLKGPGIYLAVGEVLSHAEFLQRSGDLMIRKDGLLEELDSGHFESLIRNQNSRPPTPAGLLGG
jgi:glyoxylase-like metal-dependent hydrolase (beta-lactamase superfamily II)